MINNRHAYLAAALLLSIGSCSQLVESEYLDESPGGDKVIVEATFGDSAETRTSFQGTEYKVIYWNPGDEINLFYGSMTKSRFTSTMTEASASASFEGSLSAATGSSEQGVTTQTFWGVYPYDEDNTCDGEGVTLKIKGVQTSSPNSFGKGMNPSVANSSGLSLSFYNVGGWFVFSVTESGITSVTFSGNAGEDIAGKVRVTMDSSGKPVPEVVEGEGLKTITVTPEEGDAFLPNTEYCFTVIPQTLAEGFTFTMYKGNQVAVRNSAKSLSFERSYFTRRTGLDSGLTWRNPGEPEAVDLGLPSGLMWASFNLGATRPEEYGDYYAWGETEPKDKYSWVTYKWCNGSEALMTKYCIHSSYGDNGFTDGKTFLDDEDDAAFVNLEGGWRMPTDAEWTELAEKCTWTRTSINGVAGREVTGPNGNSIFLPHAGWKTGTSVQNAGLLGLYWSSLLSTDISKYAGDMSLLPSGESMSRCERYYGLSVRPVQGDRPVVVSGVELSPGALTLQIGETSTLTATVLPANALNRTVTWTSSDESVATVSSSGVVTGVSRGRATITCTTTDRGFKASCMVAVWAAATPEAIDLGLPSGLKWASFNLGASKSEEYGDYFAWGETEPKVVYSWETYKWCNGSSDTMTKYCTISSYGNNGFTDGKTVLDDEDDAAFVNLGGGWRMPTDAEWTELADECTWIRTSINGVAGQKVTGRNGNSIFLPFAGYWDDTDFQSAGSVGLCWSSSLRVDYPVQVRFVFFSSSSQGVYANDFARNIGLSIRPVTE